MRIENLLDYKVPGLDCYDNYLDQMEEPKGTWLWIPAIRLVRVLPATLESEKGEL